MRRFMLELPDETHLALKIQAAQEGISMGIMIRKLIEEKHGKSKAQTSSKAHSKGKVGKEADAPNRPR